MSDATWAVPTHTLDDETALHTHVAYSGADVEASIYETGPEDTIILIEGDEDEIDAFVAYLEEHVC